MNIIPILLMACVVIGLIVALATTNKLGLRSSFSEMCIAANASIGRHASGLISRYAEGAITTRYLIVKKGTASDEILLCGAGDKPLGVLNDEPDGDRALASVILPASHDHTLLMVPAVDVTAGQTLYTTASGEVTNVPVGGCYIVGTAVTDGDADAEYPQVEVDPAGFGTLYQAKSLAFAGVATLSGGGVSEAITITGLLATDIVLVSVSDNGANDNASLLEGKPTADTLTVLFNEDPGAGLKVAYAVYR